MYKNEIVDEIKKVIKGKDDVIKKVLLAVLSGGHILIEDVPGVGKTTMALAFSKAMSLDTNRIQFTPDVLPSDIVGFSIYNNKTGDFEYKEGTVFCNLLLADEINRTSPKTQSALLQIMEEGKVTVDGVTREIYEPFIVIATENPVGSAGTQMLPESQLDRFIIKITVGYPEIENEIEMLKSKEKCNPLNSVEAVCKKEDIIKMQSEADDVFISDEIYNYIGNIVQLTRNNSMIELGISPRGTIALCKMAKSNAYLNNRDFVIADDILYVFKDVASHRIVLNSMAYSNNITIDKVLDDILNQVQIPSLK